MNEMKPDLTLLHENNGLCKAVERGGVICFGKRYCKGYCVKHYRRIDKYNSVDLPLKEPKRCRFIDCKEALHCHGYCRKHYRKYVFAPKNKLLKCKVDGCENNRCYINAYCGKHHSRLYWHKNLDERGSPHRFSVENQKKQTRVTKIMHEKCIVPDCNITHDKSHGGIVKGLCCKHYTRWRVHGNYNTVLDSHGRPKKQKEPQE